MNRAEAHLLRSQLFVPALSEHFVEKAPDRGADAVIVDLEDSIAPNMKTKAREAAAGIVRRIAARGLPVFVRVNNDPAHLKADLEATMDSPLAGIYLPNAESVEQVRHVSHLLRAAEQRHGRVAGTTALVLLLESPLALLHAAALAASDDSVVALVFGSEDYATAMGVAPTLEAMRMPAYQLGLAARAFGLAAWGVAGSIAEFTDLDSYRTVAVVARDAGYTGACAIHPRQIAVLNDVFGVSRADMQAAADIVAAFDQALAQGKGAVAHHGKMLDLPVVERARQMLAKARR